MQQDKQPTKKSNIFEHYHKKAMFFKSDIFILVLLLIAIVLSVILVTNRRQGEFVEIYYRGELIQRHSLNTDNTVIVERAGYNEIVISQGKVIMHSADCDNQVCVKSHAISYAGQRIICAPNGIVVLITGEEELDGITGGGNGG